MADSDGIERAGRGYEDCLDGHGNQGVFRKKKLWKINIYLTRLANGLESVLHRDSLAFTSVRPIIISKTSTKFKLHCFAFHESRELVSQ